jgi:hypothetical protein
MTSSDILTSKGYLWDNVRCNTHEEALHRALRFRQAGRFATVIKVTGSSACWKVFTRGKKVTEITRDTPIGSTPTYPVLQEDIFLSGHFIPKGTPYILGAR